MKSFLDRIASEWQPHPGQRAFLECPGKIRVLACGRRWGKTDACAAAIVGDLFQDSPSRHLILAPTQDQARILFDRVLELLECLVGESLERGYPDLHPPTPSSISAQSSGRQKLRSREMEEGEMRMELKFKHSPYPKLTFGKHTVIARSGHVGRSLRGNEATHVIVDEAAYVPESLVTEVAMPMLATNDGRLTLISTPNGLNHFWRFFKLGEAGEHGVWSRTAPSSESPYVSKDFLLVQKSLISERAYQIEYEAQFLDHAGAMFTAESIEGCTVPFVNRGEGSVVAGIDWGRYNDFTAVAILEGNHRECRLLELSQFNKADWPDMVARAVSILARYPGAPVSSDATGVGDAVTDMLRSEARGHKVEEFVFKAGNKRTLIEGLKLALERRAIAFAPDPELIKQLTHFEAQVSEFGNRTMNARDGYHDDMVIALALAYGKLPRGYQALIQVGDERKFSQAAEKLCFDDLVWPSGLVGTTPS